MFRLAFGQCGSRLSSSLAAPLTVSRLVPPPWAILPRVRCTTISCRPATTSTAAATAETSNAASASAASSDTPSPFYCTTPIFYVNAEPHIGHLHSCVLADVLTRWAHIRHGGWSPDSRRGEGKARALLATGTDEHGLKIQKVAASLGEDPQKLCDRVSGRFRDLADAAGVGYTTFIRTTESRHKAAVEEVWRRLEEGGHIYKDVHRGWYAVSDEAFYPETQLKTVTDEASGGEYKVSIETGQRVEWSEEVNYKFRMSAFQGQLVQWLESNPQAIMPPSRHAEVLEEVKSGLSDLSISRPSTRLHWGISVPGDSSQIIYVWVDALVNYLTVTGFPWTESGGSTAISDGRAQGWPADVHVVGKDILRFHAVYWPSMLLAAGLPLPRHIVAHSHWTMDHQKMSKSRGNVVDPFKEIETYSEDVMRFFLCRVGGGLASDSNYSRATLHEFFDKGLRNQLGNLIGRVYSKSQKRLLSAVAERGEVDVKLETGTSSGSTAAPRYFSIAKPRDSDQRTDALHEQLQDLGKTFDAHMSRAEVGRALDAVFALLAETNAAFQRMAPWSAACTDADLARIFYYTLEALRMTALVLAPVMPKKMAEMQQTITVVGAKDQEQQQQEGEEEWDTAMKLRDCVEMQLDGPKTRQLFPKLEMEPETVGQEESGGREGEVSGIRT